MCPPSKENAWNDFQKGNKGKYHSQRDMADAYYKERGTNSPSHDRRNRYVNEGDSGNKGEGKVTESNYVLFNKTHNGAGPNPRVLGPNGGSLQSHHGLQQQWAKENLSQYGYNPELAPTVTIETGRGMPHTSISNAQNARRNARVASGNGKWSSSLQDELQYIVNDFTKAGFSNNIINHVLEQQYKMLDKLGASYERIGIK